MLFIIVIHWTRRTPDPERDAHGRITYAQFAKTLTRAKTNASRKFRLHYGKHLSIHKIEGGDGELRTAHRDPRLQSLS